MRKGATRVIFLFSKSGEPPVSAIFSYFLFLSLSLSMGHRLNPVIPTERILFGWEHHVHQL